MDHPKNMRTPHGEHVLRETKFLNMTVGALFYRYFKRNFSVDSRFILWSNIALFIPDSLPVIHFKLLRRFELKSLLARAEGVDSVAVPFNFACNIMTERVPCY